MTAANNLIKEFCKSIGMDELGLDDKKQRSLCFDDKVIVTFLGDDTDNITAIAYIDEIKSDADMRKLLEQNFLAEAHGGARFAIEPNTDRIIMARQWNAVKTSVPELSDELEAYVNSAMQAQQFFANGGAPDTTTTEANPSDKLDSLSRAYEVL